MGGRIRDTHATGRGSLVVAGTAGYSVGNLHVPGYPLAWEGEDVCPRVHSKFANPLQVIYILNIYLSLFISFNFNSLFYFHFSFFIFIHSSF